MRRPLAVWHAINFSIDVFFCFCSLVLPFARAGDRMDASSYGRTKGERPPAARFAPVRNFPVSDFARVALLPSPPVRNLVPIARAVPARGVALMPPPLQQQPSVGTAAAQRRSAAFAALRLTSPARSRRESTRALAFPSTNSGRSLVRRRRQAAATRGAASPSQHSGRERTTNQARRRTPARTTKMAGERRCRGRRTT